MNIKEMISAYSGMIFGKDDIFELTIGWDNYIYIILREYAGLSMIYIHLK